MVGKVGSLEFTQSQLGLSRRRPPPPCNARRQVLTAFITHLFTRTHDRPGGSARGRVDLSLTLGPAEGRGEGGRSWVCREEGVQRGPAHVPNRAPRTLSTDRVRIRTPGSGPQFPHSGCSDSCTGGSWSCMQQVPNKDPCLHQDAVHPRGLSCYLLAAFCAFPELAGGLACMPPPQPVTHY